MQSPNDFQSASLFDQPDFKLAPYIDHTLLRADATPGDIEQLCREALEHDFKAVCVNSSFVNLASSLLQGSGTLVCSVVGFPLGTMQTDAKAFETAEVIASGAAEIDMVLNLGRAKSGEWQYCERDIRAVVMAAAKNPVKVILENGMLSEAEVIRACHISRDAGATWVKTSTGMLGCRGATTDDVVLMKASISSNMHVKASGGIKSREQALNLLRAGARRLGTSSGIAIVSTGTTGLALGRPDSGGY